MDKLAVTTANRSDEPRISSLIALAFANDPFWRHVYPDPLRYLMYLPEAVRLYCGNAFDHNCVHTIDDCLAVALWLPPDIHPDGEAAMMHFERTLDNDSKSQVFKVVDSLGAFHPEEPHWYLPVIGVDPRHQGRGLGSALIQHGLSTCDRERRLAYLESTNPRNISLYEQYGFELLGSVEVDATPPLYPMLRRPR